MPFPTVIFFTSRERCRAFQGALAGDGHLTDIRDGRAWLQDEATLPGPLLLFLRVQARHPSHLSLIQQKVSDIASCYVIDGEGSSGATWPGIDPCAMIWPRDHTAIVAWLARAKQECGSSASTEGGISLLDQFAALNLVGRSPAFLATLKLIKRTARTLAPVLIYGQTGTGKELVARAIHYLGPRQSRPFIPLNCGAIPDSLLESELFGYVKGAFTDAKETRTGVIDLACGGTLFLDEVDSLSQKAQITFLRFLQDQQFRSLGGRTIKQADVRIIVATNVRLSDMAARGEFRQDLLYRLAIVMLTVPSLVARREDIPLLAEHFLKKMSRAYQEPLKTFSPSTLAAMQRYDWPGNVRELENFIHRACIVTEGPIIDTASIAIHEDAEGDGSPAGSVGTPMASLHLAKAQAVIECERRYLAVVMAQADGNVTKAAKLAGTERRALGKLLKKHGMRPGRGI